MIHLERLNEPDILKARGAQWLESFLLSGNKRPSNSQYGHTSILKVLTSISHCKCYYCERQLKGVPKEIDHYIEVAVDNTKAFEWNNLYLSCNNCNDKLPHTSIPVEAALNPFDHSNEEIERHITFDKEIIRINNGSVTGDLTIKKFRLNTEELDYIRGKYLNEFVEEFSNIRRRQASERGQDFTAEEKERLLKYSYPDHPFSLMFKVILRKKGILQ